MTTMQDALAPPARSTAAAAAGLSAVLTCLLAAGCAATATFETLRPAQQPLFSVRRLAILRLMGPAAPAQLLEQALGRRLAQSGLYAVAPPAALAPAAPAPLYGPDGAPQMAAVLEAARRAGMDAVLVARVRYETIGQGVHMGDPQVTCRAAYQVVDAGSGSVLAEGVAQASYRGPLTRDRTGPTAREKVYKALAMQCGEQIADRLAPHREPVAVRLASGGWSAAGRLVSRGNRAAAAGRWDEAERHWREALASDPDNHAAQYNLGVACEARRDFPAARQAYLAAWQRSNQGLYEEALRRLERNDRDLRTAWTQLHPPVVR